MTHSSPVNAGLLPCPFCGNQPALESWDEGVSIRCKTFFCPLEDVEIPDDTLDDAKKRWNKRSVIRAQCVPGAPEEMIEVASLAYSFRASVIEACARFADELLTQSGRTPEWYEVTRSIPGEIRALPAFTSPDEKSLAADLDQCANANQGLQDELAVVRRRLDYMEAKFGKIDWDATDRGQP